MKGRIASQSRTISACVTLLIVLAVYVLTSVGQIHPAARLIFAYSVACAILIIPFNLISARTACQFIPLSQELYRRQEQFSRPNNETDISLAEMKKITRKVVAARALRLVLLLFTAYLSYRLGWGFSFSPNFPLAAIWAFIAFAGSGGFARKPTRPRRKSAAIGLLVYAIGILAPAPLVIFMATTGAIGGAVSAIGLGIFQNPLMYSHEAMSRVSMRAYLDSTAKYQKPK